MYGTPISMARDCASSNLKRAFSMDLSNAAACAALLAFTRILYSISSFFAALRSLTSAIRACAREAISPRCRTTRDASSVKRHSWARACERGCT